MNFMNKTTIRSAAVAVCAGLALLSCTSTSAPATAVADDFSALYSNLPFEMPEIARPVIPAYTVNIADFGGVPDGRTKNTDVFAAAIHHLADKGGGRLVVPAGIWYTGPIAFESNIELHLETGALVLFSDDLADYPLVKTSFEGLNTRRCMSPLSAIGKENIAITGHGTFNGNGQHWRPVKKGKMTEGQWKNLCRKGAVGKKGNIWYPNERIREVSENGTFLAEAFTQDTDSAWLYVHDYLRPVLLSFIGCKQVLLEDVTFENSPSWNLHPLMCENMILNRVTVRNPWYAQNGDGLDAESCKNVIVADCSFDVGDDAICIKSGKDKDGRERGIPCENILVEGCTVYHGHGGFVIGSEMSGGARNISVRNCLFIGTDVGLRFKSTRGRGGVVENIHIDGVKMSDIAGDALIFDLYYGGKAGSPVPPVSEETPSFKDIYISNTLCQSAGRAMFFNGLPEMPIRNIQIRNSSFHAETGAVLHEVDGLLLEKVDISQETGEKITQNQVTGLVIK